MSVLTFVMSTKADLFREGALSGESSAERLACSTIFTALFGGSPFSSVKFSCCEDIK